jgi:rhodanese-related sulfurtransferase
MKRSNLYWATLAVLLIALPVFAQTFPRRPKDHKAPEAKSPDRVVTALPVVDGDPVEVAPDRITIQQLKQKLDDRADVIILDVRGQADYRGSLVKIQGAVRVPPDEVEQHLKDWPKDKEIITYCSCAGEETSGRVAEVMSAHGFQRVKALVGGFDAWVEAGYPLEPKEKRDKK